MKRIMIIDDERALVELLQYHLEDSDYSVDPYNDGSVALDALQKDDVDLVITDIKMPGVSGLDICKFLVNEKPHIPVIVISGFSDVEDELDSLGIKTRFKKPFDLDELSNAVENYLRSAA